MKKTSNPTYVHDPSLYTKKSAPTLDFQIFFQLSIFKNSNASLVHLL